MSEDWAKWEGQVVNGVFPLRRLLGVSDHSGVFLSEFPAENLPNVALKLVPAIPTLTEAQLSHWTAALALSHPHLIRLLEVGRCQLGGLPFLFVVMEYAEQTLAQILPGRALTAEEVREMLQPILATLGFLHGQQLVQGQLKPANILVVGSQLKLASDTIRPTGEAAASLAQSCVYDPPESNDGSFSTAGDVWSLGITIAETLTQHPPASLDKRFYSALVPATVPPAFAGIVRQCLNRDPANRPTVAALDAQLIAGPPEKAVPTPRPATPESQPLGTSTAELTRAEPDRVAPPRESSRQRVLLVVVAAVLVISLVAWAGLRGRHPAPTPTSSQNSTSPLPVPPQAALPSADPTPADSTPPPPQRQVSGPPEQPVQLAAHDSPSVVHEEIPNVPRSARETIHGRIKVAVRVTVNSAGNVTDAAAENPGPSRYFTRLATTAAGKWKFAPADDQSARTWLLRFEFTRSGASGHAAPAGS